MNSPGPQSWNSTVLRALGTLVLVAVVLTVIECVFTTALPALIAVLALVGIIRLSFGRFRRDGW